MKKKITAVLLSVMLGVLPALGACGGDNDGTSKIKLYFDGGGGSGNYTTTRNYRTLQTLADEWNAKNDTYEMVINSVSLNGTRSSITSMLEAGTAPDLLMQVGNVVNDDIGNGWYADLTPYFAKVNPYEAGTPAWGEIYGESSILTSKASDGKNYYACLDTIAIGMLYNMDLLKAAGVNEAPNTYSELIACFDALKTAKANGVITADIYLPSGHWYENYLGTSVYANKITGMDLDDSKTVSSYELVKGYYEEQWSLDDPQFAEFLSLCSKKAEYYPNNYLGYDVPYKFAKGQLAVTDAVGNMMSTLSKSARFELEITGYPVLDTAASQYGGATVIRGSAGLSSAYWVTNSAIQKGQAAVDACVDFLMYLTASQNNSRLVNDLGYAMPLNVDNSNIPLFDGLKAQYKTDKANPDTLKWSACFIPGLLGTSFDDVYQLAMGDLYQDSDGILTGNVNAVITTLKGQIDDSIEILKNKYGWTFGA
jgi:ABC-type glycerol-3-phosphate transport system substrate-binding protein